ncbi:MAG TPA: right-handed parallel beta-helix repeat-containing protein, partial [Hyphomicrobiaceae bacterium]|nr:right-handed parallel beta-helix repeat-containing protein [Hyphomicrobiaceae bacterium]
VVTTGRIEASGAGSIGLEGLVIKGDGLTPGGDQSLVVITECDELEIARVAISGSKGHGLSLARCRGRITASTISGVAGAGIFSIDALGLEIASNHVHDCANNGILVWRSSPGEDGTIVTANRIERIRAD